MKKSFYYYYLKLFAESCYYFAFIIIAITIILLAKTKLNYFVLFMGLIIYFKICNIDLTNYHYLNQPHESIMGWGYFT